MSETHTDKRLFFALHQAHHALFKAADAEMLAAYGITTVQMTALFHLAQSDDCLLTDLAQRMGINNSAVTTMARRLEQRGLVTRTPCPKDRRASRLSLTRGARAVLEDAKRRIAQVTDTLFENYSDADQALIFRFLGEVTTRAQSATKFQTPEQEVAS